MHLFYDTLGWPRGITLYLCFVSAVQVFCAGLHKQQNKVTSNYNAAEDLLARYPGQDELISK